MPEKTSSEYRCGGCHQVIEDVLELFDNDGWTRCCSRAAYRMMED